MGASLFMLAVSSEASPELRQKEDRAQNKEKVKQYLVTDFNQRYYYIGAAVKLTPNQLCYKYTEKYD